MNPENNNQMTEPAATTPVSKSPHPVNQITIVSKYLALTLFVLLPFVGAYVGYQLAGEKNVEVSEPVTTSNESTIVTTANPTTTPAVIMEQQAPVNRNGVLWLTTEASTDGKTFVLSYPEEIPIDKQTLVKNSPFALGIDPGRPNFTLPLQSTSSVLFAILTYDRQHIFYLKQDKNLYVISIATVADGQVKQIISYPKPVTPKFAESYEFQDYYYKLMPSFISTSTKSVVVYNTPLPNTQKLVGHIKDLSQADKEIVMECENDLFSNGVSASHDLSRVVWACSVNDETSTNVYVSDWKNNKIVLTGTATMQPTYVRVQNNRITFANKAEANDMLRAPEYSMTLDGKDIQKENSTVYLGY